MKRLLVNGLGSEERSYCFPWRSGYSCSVLVGALLDYTGFVAGLFKPGRKPHEKSNELPKKIF